MMTYFPLEKSMYIHFGHGGALMWHFSVLCSIMCSRLDADTSENFEWIFINMGILLMSRQNGFDNEALIELSISAGTYTLKWNLNYDH